MQQWWFAFVPCCWKKPVVLLKALVHLCVPTRNVFLSCAFQSIQASELRWISCFQCFCWTSRAGFSLYSSEKAGSGLFLMKFQLVLWALFALFSLCCKENFFGNLSLQCVFWAFLSKPCHCLEDFILYAFCLFCCGKNCFAMCFLGLYVQVLSFSWGFQSVFRWIDTFCLICCGRVAMRFLKKCSE